MDKNNMTLKFLKYGDEDHYGNFWTK